MSIESEPIEQLEGVDEQETLKMEELEISESFELKSDEIIVFDREDDNQNEIDELDGETNDEIDDETDDETNIFGQKTDNSETSEFIMEILNTYIKYYQKINNKKENFNLFDEIDVNDDKSINLALSQLYELMCQYREHHKLNPLMNQVYYVNDSQTKQLKDVDQLFGIMVDGILQKISPSMFAILIEATNMRLEMDDLNYEIVPIRN